MTQHTAAYGDTPQRDYHDKLTLFNRFVEPELRQLIASLGLRRNQTVLDAGCGVGLMTQWLRESSQARVIGIDLSHEHVRAAYAIHRNTAQASLTQLPFGAGCFDWVWSSNTLNHVTQPVDELRNLLCWLKPGGRLAIGQSNFLPDMLFAWDARLEREATYACRKYYCRKYNLDERDLSAPRNWVGLLHAAGYTSVRAQTVVIERVAPLSDFDLLYFAEWFRNYWGHRVQPFLSAEDWAEVQRLTDPAAPTFAPRRDDFHHIQTYTVVIGAKP
jgi:SAM-dependent methyltransferase